MKLGVICDGISRDLAHALKVMNGAGLDYAELQFVGDKEVGDHSSEETAAIKALLKQHGKKVSCLSRHVFAGMTTTNRPGDALHSRERPLNPTSRFSILRLKCPLMQMDT